MNAFDEIMKMIKHLTPFEILTLKQNLKEALAKFSFSDFIESSRFSEGYTCPRCKSKNVIRNGKKNGNNAAKIQQEATPTPKQTPQMHRRRDQPKGKRSPKIA